MTPEALQQRSQESLIEFLETDLALSQTYLQTARLCSESDHYEALLETVQHAIATIRTLTRRVHDRVASTEIHARADALEVELRRMPPWESARTSVATQTSLD
jgi:hypothetical protein